MMKLITQNALKTCQDIRWKSTSFSENDPM